LKDVLFFWQHFGKPPRRKVPVTFVNFLWDFRLFRDQAGDSFHTWEGVFGKAVLCSRMPDAKLIAFFFLQSDFDGAIWVTFFVGPKTFLPVEVAVEGKGSFPGCIKASFGFFTSFPQSLSSLVGHSYLRKDKAPPPRLGGISGGVFFSRMPQPPPYLSGVP